jgi:hypothetical protein
MTKSIVLGLAILALSTSAALAAQRTHHHRAMNAYAAVPVTLAPAMWTGGVSGTHSYGDPSKYEGPSFVPCAPGPRVGAFATAPWTDSPTCRPY